MVSGLTRGEKGLARNLPMTIDERIEALTMQLEALTRVHEDFEKTVKSAIAEIRDVSRRLGNIAAADSIMLDDHEQRIQKLEE
jgi:hypothetical protein